MATMNVGVVRWERRTRCTIRFSRHGSIREGGGNPAMSPGSVGVSAYGWNGNTLASGKPLDLLFHFRSEIDGNRPRVWYG